MENVTEIQFNVNTTFPLWLIVCYCVFVFVGFFLNLCITLNLLQRKQTGAFSLILQLTIVDCLSTFIAVIEVWSVNKHTWAFSTTLCLVYSGSEVLINTFILYNIVCLNFHVISTVNLHLRRIEKTKKQRITTLDEEDPEEFLVQTSEDQHYNRNIVIDYRRHKNNISIIFPLLLVWFVCLSISVPQYTLSTTVIVQNNSTLCTVFDIFYNKLLQDLSMVFRIVIPVPLLLLSLLLLIKKCYQNKYANPSNQNEPNKIEKNRTLLILGIVLTVTYIILSLQRQIFYLLHIIAQEIEVNDTTNSFKMPPLENSTCSNFTNLLSSITHYTSSTFRPLIYIFVLPELRHVFNIKRKLKCHKSKP
ncbi:hypothetical protein FQA39_LY13617 [Lamprigera yunnana]|nr:hypothetical protein FQA39_LY13617 [Lamprigera yunnana]